MGWNDPDLYMQPEKYDLKVVGEVEWEEPCYSFNLTVVWQHLDGSFYVASDIGCSCPSPFENHTSLADAERFETALGVIQHLQKELGQEPGEDAWSYDRKRYAYAAPQVVDLTSRLLRS